MTRVSIVIPVYNGANYLAEAIDSALAQTARDVEILVINDGSTDGGATEAIARGYGDRIRYIPKPNGGVASALNRGIAEMHGEWFCWLSHDDRFLPQKTERQLAYASANPDARIIGCDFELIDDNGQVYDVYRSERAVIRNGHDLLESWIFGCALMIHRTCFDETGPFNESNRTTQDLEMWLRLIEHYPIEWMPEILCQWRQHPLQGSRTEARYGRDHDELYARMFARYDATYYDPAARTPQARARVYHWLLLDALRRRSWAGAQMAIDRAWREWRSLRNPSLFPRIVGPKRFLAWIHMRNFVVGKLDSLRRRLRLGERIP